MRVCRDNSAPKSAHVPLASNFLAAPKSNLRLSIWGNEFANATCKIVIPVASRLVVGGREAHRYFYSGAGGGRETRYYYTYIYTDL